MAKRKEGPAQLPADLPTGDDDFAKVTMQAALQRAAEKAGMVSVAEIPTAEAPLAPELPPDAEIDVEVAAVKRAYLDLAADIRGYRTASIERLDPQRDLPTEWGAAYATFNNVQTFAQDYRKEKDPTKKAQILKKIEFNADQALWQRIYEKVTKGLERLQAEPIPNVPAEASANAEPLAPEVQPVAVEPAEAPPPAAPATLEVAAPAPKVAPPAAPAKKAPATRAKHEKKKHTSAKEKIASIAASTPAEQVDGRVYGLSMTADEVKRYRAALAKAVRKASAKPAESAKEAFDPEALLKEINNRYDELAGEMKAEHIEPAEVLFAMRPVSAIEARLQAALDAREATNDLAAKVKAEREARAAYDELMGPATEVVREAIARARVSHDALEASEAEGAPTETLESPTPPEGSKAAKTLAKPVEALATDTLESSPVPPGSAAAEILARPIEAGPSRGRMSRIGARVSAMQNERTGQMPHINERIEKAQQALAARSAELDKKVEGFGPAAERLVRSIGERYNKLSLKQKLLIGGVLAAGAVGASIATGGASIWWTFGILSGYRAVAGAGTFVALEGAFQRGKEKGDHWWNRYPKAYAATAAALVASGLVGRGIGFVADSTGVSGWLKAHWPFGGTPAHPGFVKAPGAALPASPSGSPTVSVEVKPGYGYESMIRQLTGQIHGQDPSLYPENSDAHRLLTAKPERLNNIILQIEKEHGFVKPDGTSAVVGQGSRMSFDAQGRLVPANTLEAHAAPPATHTPVTPHAPVVPVEHGHTTADLNKQELERIKASLRPSGPPASQLNAQEFSRPHAPLAPEPMAPRPTVPGPERVPPPPPMPTAYPPTPFVNHFNVPIDPTQGGIYQGPNNAPIAFGNNAMAAAEAYARAHHRVPVWVQAPQPYMDHGVPRPYAIPVEHRGFFRGGMHHGMPPPGGPPPEWRGPVNPQTFTKRLH